MYVCGSTYENGCVVDGMCAMYGSVFNPSCNYHNRDCNKLCKQFEADVFITSLIGYGSYTFSTGVLSPTLFST